MNKPTTYNLPSGVVIGCRLVSLAIPSWSCLPGIICVRILNRLTRCTVLTPLHLTFATSRMEYPLRSRLITSLYSAFICSSVFTEPILRPSFPSFSIYRFRPDCNRNEILSRSNCVQVESVAIIIGAKRDGLPSSSNNVSCSFVCEYSSFIVI